MKYFFLIISICLGNLLHAQEFYAIPLAMKDIRLDQMYTRYEVYTLDPNMISEYMQRQESGAPLKLVFGDQVFEWTVYENQILRPDCRISTIRDGKYQSLEVDRKCRTFVGFRPDMEKEARFTISKGCFAAMIPVGKTYTMIQPITQLIGSAEKNVFVLYKVSDAIRGSEGFCELEEVPTVSPSEEIPIQLPTSPLPANRTYTCLEMEVALATDHRMFITYGSADAVLDLNLTVMNFVEPFYDDFDIDFWTDDFFIVTSTSGGDTPWGTSLDMDVLKDEFEDWADNWFGAQDIGHLWTSGNIYKDDFDYGILGRADIGGACGDIGITPWTVLENNVLTDFYDLAILQAHEYGHLLDADHEPGTGTIMEPNFGDTESATWAQANIEEMFDFIEDEGCIESCTQCPGAYNIYDYIGWGSWRYSALVSIESSAVIDSSAQVVFQSAQWIKFKPGFVATAFHPTSLHMRLIAKIEGCE